MPDDPTELRRALTDLNTGVRSLLGLGGTPELLAELLELRDEDELRAARRRKLRRHLRLVPDPDPDHDLDRERDEGRDRDRDPDPPDQNL